MGHDGCCGQCAGDLAQVKAQVAAMHEMMLALADAMSKLGGNPMARSMLRSMGITMPEVTNGANK